MEAVAFGLCVVAMVLPALRSTHPSLHDVENELTGP